MRISNEQAQQIMAAQKTKGPQGAKSASEVGPASSTDAVSVSAMGQDLQKALQALGGVPDVRADRVAELKERIDAGTYQVSGQDIAQSLLRRASDKLV